MAATVAFGLEVGAVAAALLGEEPMSWLLAVLPLVPLVPVEPWSCQPLELPVPLPLVPELPLVPLLPLLPD
jgi:hypothetical protein